ncbi:MAG: sigma-70 family RNA polymerase sigma factor [Candidatus Nealsonbacteria bacterium]|nr:sigma-70 family RNA polymerase sigma factor [Candidatus Nealsonbacteria bacterium]
MPPGPMAKAPSDEELARRAQEGCTASFEELVRRFQVPLLHFLRRWTSTEEAEDLVQDTFVRAYRNLHRYRPTARLATWLFTIARRLSINRQRKRQPVADSPMLEFAEGGAPPPGRIVAEQESRRRLWELADEVLSERQRTALWLYYVEDMSVGEVAEVVGHSRGATKTMLFRARRKLSTVLVGTEFEPENKTIAEYTNG